MRSSRPLPGWVWGGAEIASRYVHALVLTPPHEAGLWLTAAPAGTTGGRATYGAAQGMAYWPQHASGRGGAAALEAHGTWHNVRHC